MKNNILVSAAALSDQDLLAHLEVLAGNEREASVELVAHLAALDSRPALYAARGYGSLFSYCTQALRLSEDAACNRIAAARACRRFPLILELLATGSLTLTSVRLLARHLTAENHEVVLAKAGNRSLREIEALVAGLAPRPDVASTVRKLPGPKAASEPAAGPVPAMRQATLDAEVNDSVPSEAGTANAVDTPITALPSPAPATTPPIVRALAPDRYLVRFTIGSEANEKLRRIQTLLRREIPNGDPGAIFERALTLLLEKVEKTKLGAAARPRPDRPIRPATDKIRRPSVPSRHVPQEVKNAVWRRDGGQCAFVAPSGRRCAERTFLEFHHVQPYALQGPATVGNISLRCRRHNQYEAELIFGPPGSSIVREAYVGP
jgi:5-methylcytosine-specific restriction endonuclease McrA